MTTYNTGNPLPSADARDRYDNSQTFDEVINGTLTFYKNRVGNNILSMKGMGDQFNAAQVQRASDFTSAQQAREAQFNALLSASGFENPPLVYVDGSTLSVARPTQLVSRGGNLYSVKLPAAFPKTLTGTWVTDEPSLVLRNDQSVRQDLAATTGAGMVGWTRSVQPAGSPFVYGLKGALDSSRISIQEKEWADLAIKPAATVNDPRTWDWAPAWQGLVNSLIARATAAGTTYGLAAIRIPPYQYKMNSPITIPNWIKCAFEGFSIFDFSGAPAGTDHLSISASSLAVPASSFSYNGPCLDGSGGSLLVRGSGLGSSTSAGIFAGNKVAGTSVSREIGLINISVQNCNRALEFGKYGSYLFAATGCRFENNFWNIVTPTGTVSNSGERMVFDKCIIAGSGDGGASIRHQCDTMDLFFTNCSFDFNYDVLLCDVGCTYCAITFDTCHFEGWDNFLVNWKSSGANVFINFNTPTILPTTYRLANPLVLNSAARPLVKFGGAKFSRVDVKIHNPVIRMTHAPWIEDPFMSINDNPSDDPAARKVLTVTGYTPYAFNAFGSAGSVENMDFDFQKDAVGTAVSAMTSWMRAVTPSNVTSDALADDGAGKKVLALTATNVTNYYFLKSKVAYSVRPGQTVYTWAALSLKGLTMPDGSNPLRSSA